MSAVELLEQAKAEGILLVLDGERLSWAAKHQPPAELLAEIKAHRLEIIARLKVANESPEALAWLACVADLLRCSPDYLLLHGFVDRHDLAEQHQQEPWRAARLIRTDPRWRQPSEHSSPADEEMLTAEMGEFRAQFAREGSLADPLASDAWLAARNAYHRHALGGCPDCYPRGNRHCGIGTELRARYDHETHALGARNAEGDA